MNDNVNRQIFTCGVGVWKGPYPAEELQHQLIKNLENEINQKSGKKFTHLKAVSFKRQIMRGNNYLIKVEAGEEYIHVRIDEEFNENGKESVIKEIQYGKTLQDEIKQFE